MKILIVGSNKHWATERYFVDHLREFSAEVFQYNAPDIVFDNHSKNILNKILFKTKIRTGYKEVNDGLLSAAQLVNPDVIWVWKGMEIFPGTLKKLRSRGFKLANFNPDHPFIITSAGSGNSNVTNSVGLYDLHFCYHRKLISEIEERFHIPAVFLPFAYEKKDLTYLDPAGLSKINRVCFQGNPDNYRANMLSSLAMNGLEVDVYGQGWEKTKLAGMKNVRVYPIASRPDFWKKNQEYRIQLNLFRQYNEGSHNMRTFEIPAVGGIQLTEYSVEQADFFKEGEEIFFFRGKEDMLKKVNEILQMPESIITEIRNHARKRCLESGYTFTSRAMTVYKSFEKLI